MASFKDLIKAGKTKVAYLKKQGLVGSVQQELLKIGSLDAQNPSIRIFEYTQDEAKAILAELAQSTRELNIALFEQNPQIYRDDDYKKDMRSDVEMQMQVQKDLEEYIKVMNDKDIQYPPEVVAIGPNIELNEILTSLVICQSEGAAASNAQQLTVAQQHKETIESLQKHGQTGPKAS